MCFFHLLKRDRPLGVKLSLSSLVAGLYLVPLEQKLRIVGSKRTNLITGKILRRSPLLEDLYYETGTYSPRRM